MTSKEYYDRANEAFVGEDLEEALKLYELGIELDPNADQCHAGASQVYLKLNKFTDALTYANKALDINNNNAVAYFRKGIALFEMGDVKGAKLSFEEALKIKVHDTKILEWFKKCEKLTPEKDENNSGFLSSSEKVSDTNKPKYDWYQSDTHIVMTVLLKNVHSECFACDVQDRRMTITIKQPERQEYNLSLHLAHKVVPEQSHVKFLPSKVEVKLKKVEGMRWDKLEWNEEDMNLKYSKIDVIEEGEPMFAKYPSSSHHKKDWDKLIHQINEDEKDEKLEGDAALNKLFQQIYAQGSDDVKKAMLKSYMESSGTVLSTNWCDISKKRIDVQPPDGLEFKKWSS